MAGHSVPIWAHPFWPEVRHQATHPAAVTKPGAPFGEAVGIYRAPVKANLPARPGDLALAASQVPIGFEPLDAALVANTKAL